MQAHFFRSFDSVKIDDLVAVEHIEVTGFADFFDEANEDGVAPRALRRAHLHYQRQCRQARPDAVALLERLALHHTAARKQSENPVDGRLRQAASARQLLEAARRFGLGDQLEQRYGAQGRRIGFRDARLAPKRFRWTEFHVPLLQWFPKLCNDYQYAMRSTCPSGELVMTTYQDDLVAPEVIEDPYSYFGRLREEDPVHWNPQWEAWVLTRYDDLLSVFRRPGVFASDRATFYSHYLPKGREEDFRLVFHVYPRWLGGNDPPVHDHMRRIVNTHWTPAKIQGLRSQIRKTVNDLLDGIEEKERAELLHDFAMPLPSIIISALIGVPHEHWPKIKRWSDDWGQLHFNPDKNVRRWDTAVGALKEFYEYVASWVRDRKARPADDYFSRMLSAEFDGDRLSEDEIIVHITEQLFAGHETTANLIGNGMYLFMRHRDQWDRLRREPSLAVSAVEEVMRYEGPVKMTTRWAKRDIDVQGTKIREGDRLLLILAAANRDPRQFPDPDRFDIGRSPNEQLTFGHGIHFCLGAPLARLEGEEAFLALAKRFPTLTLETEDLKHLPLLRARALETLPVCLRQ